MYYSDRPREIENAAKVNIVCNEIKEGMFLRTTYREHLNLTKFNANEIPKGNFFFLIHFMDKFNSDLVLNFRDPENVAQTKIDINDPESWGPTVKHEAFIPDEIVELIIAKRVKILAHNDHINIDERFTYKWIEWICRTYPGISAGDFVFLVPCAGESKFCTIDNTPWGLEIIAQLTAIPGLQARMQRDIESKTIRKNKFICLNGRPTMHRQFAVTRLFNYREEGILTFSESLGRFGLVGPDGISSPEIAGPPDEAIAKRYYEIQKHFPLQWDISSIAEYSEAANLVMSDEYVNENLSTYLNIVTETRFYTTQPVWFSEKTFRAIMFMQPFVILGAAGSIRALRDRGYKTFGQWIDESYDNIDDDVERCQQALTSAIEFFGTRTPEELAEVLKDMLPILLHNYFHAIGEYSSSSHQIINRLLNLVNSDTETTAINPLVYDANKIQHGISVIPYALPDYAKVFKAIAYSEHVQLPERFYFQLDRGLMDIAWITVTDPLHNRPMDFENSIQDIPTSVCEAVEQGRAKFIFHDWGNLENVNEFALLVDTIVQKLNARGYTFTSDDFVIVTGSSWQAPGLKFVSFNFWETYFTEKFDEANPGLNSKIVDNIRKKSIRKNKFICLNGQYIVSRLATVTLLSDLRDQGILTLVNSFAPLLCPPSMMEKGLRDFGQFSPELAHQFDKDIRNTLPWHWSEDLKVDYSHVSWDWAYDTQRIWTVEKGHVNSALDCYLNIVTESNYQYNGMVRHTEKVFKAMNLLQPFVIIGEPGQLSSLQTLGYKTFNRWIDESYDYIEDPEVRVFAAVEAAREFINKDSAKLIEILNEMLPILLHNKKLAQYRQRTAWSRLEVDLSQHLAK